MLALWLLGCCWEDMLVFKSSLTIRQRNIHTKRAPEPSDVLWENAGVSRLRVLRNELLSYAMLVLLLGLSFGIIYGLSVAQAQIGSGNFLLSVLISLIITAINVALKALVRYFT